MVSTVDSGDPRAISGLPFAAARALERRGAIIVPLQAADPPKQSTRKWSRVRSLAKRVLPSRLSEWPAHVRSARTGCVFGPAIDAAERVSAQLAAARSEAPIDALVGICVSVPLAFLETDLPMVYASDATARIVLGTYPRYARRHRTYREECEECERRALRRASFVALASEAAAHSAVRDYDVDPARVDLVPLGCHIVPEHDDDSVIMLPTRDNVRLLIVASDPERKRLGLAVNAIAELRRRGVGAELWHIGEPHRTLRRPFVRSLGPLRLGVEADAAKHRDAIRSTHLSILPSMGEAFGIAPAESAMFGRPAVVSNAGGLSTVVRHDETGLVLPLSAHADAWADAIERLVAEPERYRRYAVAARSRAWNEFTWDRWAERIEGLIRRAIAERTAEERDRAIA